METIRERILKKMNIPLGGRAMAIPPGAPRNKKLADMTWEEKLAQVAQSWQDLEYGKLYLEEVDKELAKSGKEATHETKIVIKTEESLKKEAGHRSGD